ncbi:MAG: hypothetical protein ACI964_001860, partial [Spirosomataceae bacterium]
LHPFGLPNGGAPKFPNLHILSFALDYSLYVVSFYVF